MSVKLVDYINEELNNGRYKIYRLWPLKRFIIIVGNGHYNARFITGPYHWVRRYQYYTEYYLTHYFRFPYGSIGLKWLPFFRRPLPMGALYPALGTIIELKLNEMTKKRVAKRGDDFYISKLKE